VKVAITGSSGLIGTALVASLRADDHEVVRLVRRPPRAVDEVRWDPRAADAGIADLDALRGVSACVNLAGPGVASRRWTARYKTEIKASRVLGTRALAGALGKLTPLPSVLVSASAIGFYGSTGTRGVADAADESAPAGKGFLAGLVQEWEAAADPAREAGIRVVHPRSGLVLARDGGLLARLAPLARLGPVSLLPRFGSGSQTMSWISLSDEIAAIRFLLDRQDISGPVNLTSPEPVSNAEFTAALAAAVGRRDLPWLRVPAPVLRLALGEASVELLGSARIVPARLLQAGYEFRHPAIREALNAEYRSAGS
jgi:uncharacterized protein (TIGR01777 family)